MIISFLNQKGGTGKSTLARAVAVEFARNGWAVHVADMDVVQKTAFTWAGLRSEAEIMPPVEVALYRDPKTALKASETSDLLIVDGKAFADTHALEVAKLSDLVVIPVGVSVDDLKPTLELASELVTKGIARNSLFFVVCKVMENGDREAMNTRQSIENWAFDVAKGWVPFQAAFSQAMDSGRALSETKYKSLNEKIDGIIQQIVDKAMKGQQKQKAVGEGA